MSLSGKKLHYRKNQNYDINLYDSKDNTGSPALNIYTGGQILYSKIGATNDTKASPLRVMHGGTIKSVLTTAEIILPASSWIQAQGESVTIVNDTITLNAYVGAFDRYWMGYMNFVNPRIPNAKLCFRVKKRNYAKISVGYNFGYNRSASKEVFKSYDFSVSTYIEVPLDCDSKSNYINFGSEGSQGLLQGDDKVYFTDVKIIG